MRKLLLKLNISPSALKNRRGFSLLECVVALAVFAVMALLVATILQMTVLQYKRNYENAERLDEDEQKIVAENVVAETSNEQIKIQFPDSVEINNQNNAALDANAAQAAGNGSLKTIQSMYRKITADNAINATITETLDDTSDPYSVALRISFDSTASNPKVALPLGTDVITVNGSVITSNTGVDNYSLSKNELTYNGDCSSIDVTFTISEADYKKHYDKVETYFGGSTVTYTP